MCGRLATLMKPRPCPCPPMLHASLPSAGRLSHSPLTDHVMSNAKLNVPTRSTQKKNLGVMGVTRNVCSGAPQQMASGQHAQSAHGPLHCLHMDFA